MGEKYEGRKFRTVFKREEFPEDSRIMEIMEWAPKFKEMGLLPAEAGGNAGNMSFRNSRGFIITAGGVDKGKLNPRQFVQVLSANIDTARVVVEGEVEPSSETLMHRLIYGERRDVNAIIHVHDSLVMEHAKRLGLPSTKKQHPYGTPELAYEVQKALDHHRYIVVKGHGVLSLGKSVWEAGNQIISYHEAARHPRTS
jgi:ribulose-5-phosphate 4-epimerase/fuculose-1-phosphate aldolase